ncbi:MAG: toll/interleukin-1 receptor domain-containing protein [Clostridia bacterium]|nr:toll/interleukin-1 receptor domain-containing protein [Clostridia bacterium]
MNDLYDREHTANEAVNGSDDPHIYVFVSHSHLDIAKVRVLRNYLESLRAEPILFFLKSLSDKDTITDLIEKEIDARLWFILCDSSNARESEWVRSETEYAQQTHKTYQMRVDLERDFAGDDLTEEKKDEIRSTLRSIEQTKAIFLNYSHKDAEVVRSICRYLERYGIKFFSFEDIPVGGSWWKSTETAIETCPFFLSFVSDDYLSSGAALKELSSAIRYEKKPIFVYLAKGKEPKSKELLYLLNGKDYFLFDTSDIQGSSNALMYYLQRLLKK